MTVARLYAEMTSTELLGWGAFFALEGEDQKARMEKFSRRR